MNKRKQFWTLVRFQYLLNPLLWFLPLVFGVISFMPFWIHGDSTYHQNLSFYIQANQTFFFVGIFGSIILLPEKFQFKRTKTIPSFFGTEFLLTRAVDRPVVYRAKAFLVYALILLLPLVSMLYFVQQSDLIVNEDSNRETHQVLTHVPGSKLIDTSTSHSQPNIVIPHGSVLIAGLLVWILILSIIALQLSISVLSPFKYGGIIFWVLCYAGLLGPTFLPLYAIEKHAKEMPSPAEKLFFFFMDHQPIIWTFTFIAVLLCQVFCERRFSREEL